MTAADAHVSETFSSRDNVSGKQFPTKLAIYTEDTCILKYLYILIRYKETYSRRYFMLN